MKYDIYQISLTHAEVELLNRIGWAASREENPKIRAYCDMSTCKNTAQHFRDGHYTKVAEIDADNLEQVFDIGNMGPESSITRLGRMHSVSVGDVVLDEAGVHHVVASIGFDALEL